MMRLLNLIALLGFAAAAQAGVPECVWFGDGQSLKQYDAIQNKITLALPLREPREAVMSDKDCGVWVLGKQRRVLYRFEADGRQAYAQSLRQLDEPFKEADHLAYDAAGKRLWLHDGQWLGVLDVAGAQPQLINRFRAAQPIKALALDRQGRAWVLGGNQLSRYSASASQGRRAVPAEFSLRLKDRLAEAKHLVIDPLAQRAWLAGEHALSAIDLASGNLIAQVRLREDIESLALDPATGEVWLGLEQAIERYDASGARQLRIVLNHRRDHHDPDRHGKRDERHGDDHEIHPRRLAVEPASGALWVAGQRALARYSRTGELLTRIDSRDGDDALAASLLAPRTHAALDTPADGALLNRNRIVHALSAGLACNGGPCNLSPEREALLRGEVTVSGSLDAQALAFSGDGYLYSSAEQTLADGEHVWTAVVRDGLGEAARLEGHYTVDTRPPQIVDLTPPSGSRFNLPNITVQGRADEPGAVIHLANPDELQAQGGNPQTEQFAWGLTLQPGDNSVTLTAVDLAGNAFTLKPVYGYDPYGTVAWQLRAPKSGTYRLTVNWIGQASPTGQVAYRIQHANGESVATAAPGSQSQSLALGEYRFEANVDYLLKLTSQDTVGTYTVADAAQLEQIDGEEVAYAIHADQLNSPRVVTDANRQVVWRWDNTEPFGANAANENPNNLGAFVMNLRFPGQYYDGETNKHYNYYRDYDPNTGRYIQSDPIGLGGGLNTYAYVGGNPVRYSDQLGLLSPVAAAGIVAGALACKSIYDLYQEYRRAQEIVDRSNEANRVSQEALNEYLRKGGPPPRQAMENAQKEQQNVNKAALDTGAKAAEAYYGAGNKLPKLTNK